MEPLLERRIRDFYDGLRLSEARVERILSAPVGRLRPRRWFALSAATMLAVFLGGVSLWRAQKKSDLVNHIVQEVAYDHQKPFSPKVVADRYDILQASLSRLDFDIRPPAFLPDSLYRLLGGSYCSVHGELAVQAHLVNRRTQGMISLYVTKLSPDFKTLRNQVHFHGGVWVRFRREGERFFVVAGEAKPPG